MAEYQFDFSKYSVNDHVLMEKIRAEGQNCSTLDLVNFTARFTVGMAEADIMSLHIMDWMALQNEFVAAYLEFMQEKAAVAQAEVMLALIALGLPDDDEGGGHAD